MKAYCYDDFVNEHDSVDEAVDEAEDALDEYRTNASDDGWHEEDEEYWDQMMMECGRLPPQLGGGCTMAGSEHCDFDCPFRNDD